MASNIPEQLENENNPALIDGIADLRDRVANAPTSAMSCFMAYSVLENIGDIIDDIAPEARAFFERYAPPPTP